MSKKKGKKKASKVRQGFNARGRPYQPGVLAAAVDAGDYAQVKAMLARGADPNDETGYGQTALMRAVWHGEEMLKLLVGAGADVNRARADGETAVVSAAIAANLSAVRLLTENGADLDAKHFGDTALMWAIIRMDDPEVARYLIGKSGNLDMPDDKWGRNALMLAIRMDRVDAVNWILDKGCDLSFRDKEGKTALHHAAGEYRDRAGIARGLIAAGADVNARDAKGDTPLMAAAEKQNLGILEALLDAGADVNAKNGRGLSALLYVAEDARKSAKSVCRVNDEEKTGYFFKEKERENVARAVTLLVGRGADTRLVNRKGQTALDILAKLDYPELAAAVRTAENLRQHKTAARRQANLRKAARGPFRL